MRLRGFWARVAAGMDYIAGLPARSLRALISTVRADYRERLARRLATLHEECGKHCIPAAGIDEAISHLHPTGVPFVDSVVSYRLLNEFDPRGRGSIWTLAGSQGGGATSENGIPSSR